jgi:hypothetical protein
MSESVDEEKTVPDEVKNDTTQYHVTTSCKSTIKICNARQR